MTETLAALLFAHVLADFVLQTRWMVANKRRLPAMAAHTAIVLGAAIATTGTLHPVLIALTAAHLAIDLIKTFAAPRNLWSFLGDQAAHLATVFVLALCIPDLWATGAWSGVSNLPALMATTAGLILSTRAGGFAMALLMEPWAAELIRKPEHAPGLTNGGQAIGHLERGLIFLMVLTGQAEGIGFLIAAKSVLRFGTVGDDRAVSEYVIIGTLASFAWAIAAAFLTVALLGQLPPLGIPDLTP